MNTSADSLLNEISQVFIAKLNAQKLDPKFLHKLFDDLFKKIIFANSKKDKKTTTPEATDRNSQAADTWSKKIKKAFYDLTEDRDYEKRYKQFLKRAFDTTKINSLIPSIGLDNNLYNNIDESNINKTDDPVNSQPIVKEFVTKELTKEIKTEIAKEVPTSIKNAEIEYSKPQQQPVPIQEQNKPSTDKTQSAEIKEIKVVVDQKNEPLNVKTDTQTAKEQPAIIKELKTDSVVTNELKTITNTEQQPPQVLKETQTEIKNQPIVVKEIKTDSVLTKEVKSEIIKDQSDIVNELKSSQPVNAPTVPNATPIQQDYEEGRVNVIKETPKIQLDGISSSGQNALTNVLEPIFKNTFQEFLTKQSKDSKGKKQKDDEKGLFEQLGDMATFLRGALPAITSVLGRAAPLLAKVAGPIAAIAGGEFIGGQIGKWIGSNETVSKFLYGSETAGKEAYEKYGTGMIGLGRASYDLYKQGKENRQQQEEHKKMSEARITQSKESMVGKRKYNTEEEARRVKVVEDLKKQEEALKKQYEELKAQAWDGWNPFHDEQKETDTRQQLEGIQEILAIQQNKLEQFRKLKTENSGEPKPPVPLKDGGLVTKPTFAMIAEEKPELVLPTSNTFNYDQSKMYSANSDGIVSLDKLFNSQDFSLNNTSLNDIAANTKDTNSSLKSLGDAMFKLVSVFDKKMTQGNTTIIAGGSNKSSGQPMPASAIANSNIDPIRRVRMQFA